MTTALGCPHVSVGTATTTIERSDGRDWAEREDGGGLVRARPFRTEDDRWGPLTSGGGASPKAAAEPLRSKCAAVRGPTNRPSQAT
jgi:hypothetical protein